jgi:anti-sigma regulatory factor (Ser/Thr protein kinase)
MSAASTTLPAEASSVPAARRFVRTALQELGLDGAYEAAEFLASEIATNAVLHARTAFTVQVLREGDVARVCVMDLSPVLPRQRSYGTESTTGRGLRLVATLAAAWGVEQTAAGKTVWFEVPAAGDDEELEEWPAGTDLDALLATYDEL